MTIQIRRTQIGTLALLNTDIDTDAQIAESKLALTYDTHSNANDPSADQKAALAGEGTPSGSNKYATKSYVDGVAVGLAWQEPVKVLNVIDDSLTAPPTPVPGDAYIVAQGGTGDWAGLDHHLVEYPSGGTSWIDHGQLTAGDRLLVTYGTPAGGFAAHDGDIATVATGGDAPPTFTFTDAEDGWALMVNAEGGVYENCQYVFDTGAGWVQVGGLGQVTAGAGLIKTGNTLDVIAGDDSILVGADSMAVQHSDIGGLQTLATADHEGLAVKLVTASGLVLSTDGLAVQAFEEEVVVSGEAKATWALMYTPKGYTRKIFQNGQLLRKVAANPTQGEYTFDTATATFGVAVPIGEWLFAQYLY